MANLMSQVKLKNHTSRDAFDLSRKNAFTAKIGELLPVCCIECIPGDSIKGRVQHFTRTMPVNTAAYTRIREYYDWFFVPTNLLWNKFNTWVSAAGDNIQHSTSLIGQPEVGPRTPYISAGSLADYIAGMSSNQQNYNIFNYSRAELTCKLLHYLGYGDYYQSLSGTAQTFRLNSSLNPFPLLAYQKIYQDFFRNSAWENTYAPAFNIDYMSADGENNFIPLSQLIGINRTYENMLDMRYCNWNKDMFMGLLPNSQMGSEASVITDGSGGDLVLGEKGTYSVVGNIITSQSADTDNGVIVPANQTNVKTADGRSIFTYFTPSNLNAFADKMGLNSASVQNIQSSFGILALRQAEAMQKWKEIIQSNIRDYKHQVQAQFGVTPSDAYSERCRYVDGVVNSLDISEVTNQNITGDNAADIAGKGVGVGDGSFKFKTDIHGYLMCIYHAVPLLDYASDGVKKMNYKTYLTDYAQPVLDKCGMVALPTIELTNSPNNPTFTPSLLGYLPRYYDYKTAVDEVHGAFYNGTEDLASWVAPVDQSYITKYLESMHGDGSGLTYQFMKVNPAILNPIFAQDVDSSVDTDQLLVNTSFDITAVRNLDRDGLPY